jgi:hypothetical protein
MKRRLAKAASVMAGCRKSAPAAAGWLKSHLKAGGGGAEKWRR